MRLISAPSRSPDDRRNVDAAEEFASPLRPSVPVVLPRFSRHASGRGRRERDSGGDDLAGDQPDRIAARCCFTVGFDMDACRFHVSRHMQRLDVGIFADPVLVAPGEKLACRPIVSHAGVLVADGGGEKFQEAACGCVAGVGDHAGTTMPSRAATARVRSGGMWCALAPLEPIAARQHSQFRPAKSGGQNSGNEFPIGRTNVRCEGRMGRIA